MTDVHSPDQRRRNMQAVRNRDTKQEQQLRMGLRGRGIRGYRKNAPCITGRPDVAFTRWRVAVFVDGCFWHGCPDCYKAPSSNSEFWQSKLSANRTRDKEVDRLLREAGWTVLRFCEHEVKADIDTCVDLIEKALRRAGRHDPA